MKKETLNSVGLKAQMDVPAGELFSRSLDASRYGLDGDDVRTAQLLRDFVSEYNREIPDDEAKTVSGSGDAAKFLYPVLRSLDHEEAWALYLTKSNKVIRRCLICTGSLDQTVIDSRRIVREALDCSAAGVILFHNHPSGNPRPSFSDVKQTEALKNCLDVFDISLTDHIVVSDTSYYSFNDEGVTKFKSIKD